MTRVVGLLLFGWVVGACGSKSSEEGKVDSKATEGFIRALEAAAAAPAQAAATLAEGAFETIAPSMKCFESFAQAATGRARAEALLDCGLACTEEAVQRLKGKDPGVWMAELAAVCQPAHFGLEKSNAALLSPEWFLMRKVGELAGPRVKAAEGPAKVRLEKAMTTFKLALPLPATAAGVYELATVPVEGTIPVAPRAYVVVPPVSLPPAPLVPDFEPLRVGLTPVATFAPGGAALAGEPAFPGAELAQHELAAAIAGTGGARGGGRPAGEVVALRGAVDRNLGGDGGRGETPVALLLADDGADVADIIDIAAELGPVMIGVASQEEPSARALPVRFSAATAADLAAAKAALRVTISIGGVEVDPAPFDGGRRAGELHGDTVPAELIQELQATAKELPEGKPGEVIIDVQGQGWRIAAPLVAWLAANGATGLILTTSELDPDDAPVRKRLPRVEVAPGGGTVSSETDRPLVDRIVRSWLLYSKLCYRKELNTNPALAGQVDVEFTIQPDGSVTDLRGADGNDAVLVRCASQWPKRGKFPPPKAGPVKVRYPVIFEAKD